MSFTQLSIWVIPGLVDLPTPMVETLQVLSDLLPYVSLAPRNIAYEDADLRAWCVQRDARVRRDDFDAWTAEGARLGLLTWPERDAIVARLRSHAHATA